LISSQLCEIGNVFRWILRDLASPHFDMSSE